MYTFSHEIVVFVFQIEITHVKIIAVFLFIFVNVVLPYLSRI